MRIFYFQNIFQFCHSFVYQASLLSLELGRLVLFPGAVVVPFPARQLARLKIVIMTGKVSFENILTRNMANSLRPVTPSIFLAPFLSGRARNFDRSSVGALEEATAVCWMWEENGWIRASGWAVVANAFFTLRYIRPVAAVERRSPVLSRRAGLRERISANAGHEQAAVRGMADVKWWIHRRVWRASAVRLAWSNRLRVR